MLINAKPAPGTGGNGVDMDRPAEPPRNHPPAGRASTLAYDVPPEE